MCTYLFRTSLTTLPSCLSQFQATTAEDKEDNRRLILSLNRKLGKEARSEESVHRAFDALWDRLVNQLSQIGEEPIADKGLPDREPSQILEDLLHAVSRLPYNVGARVDRALALSLGTTQAVARGLSSEEALTKRNLEGMALAIIAGDHEKAAVQLGRLEERERVEILPKILKHLPGVHMAALSEATERLSVVDENAFRRAISAAFEDLRTLPDSGPS